MLQQFLGIFGYLAQEWKYTLIFPHQIKGSLNHYLHISMYASVSAVRWLWEDKTRVSNSCYNPAWEAESTDVTVAASQLVTSQFFFFHFFFLKIFFFFFWKVFVFCWMWNVYVSFNVWYFNIHLLPQHLSSLNCHMVWQENNLYKTKILPYFLF